MIENPKNTKNKPKRSNGFIVGVCLLSIAAMGGLSYASVPLYQIFCQVTGYGGTTKSADSGSDRVLERTITIRFDANTKDDLGWDFQPKQREITVKIGETAKIHYFARNLGKSITSGQATFNVTPMAAGAYFNKIECFCFTDTTLKPGEEIDMPVVFFIDPDIIDAEETQNLNTITLSYSFFKQKDDEPEVSSLFDGAKGKEKL